MAFTPKGKDGRAHWRSIYDRLSTTPPGGIVRHAELLELLGTDDRGLMYASVHRAAKELRKRNQRDIMGVRGEGYRVLYANEHIGKAEAHKSRAVRQIRVANDVVDATDLSALSPSERHHLGLVKTGMVLLYQAISTHEVTLAKHEELLQSLEQRVQGLEQPQPALPPTPYTHPTARASSPTSD